MAKKQSYDFKKTLLKVLKIGLPYLASFLVVLSTEMPEFAALGVLAHIYLDYKKHK